MSFDMQQFLQTFYEESFEGLDIMESELLKLDVGSADSETINTIFRAAHSIKGGSATFGLTSVGEFTHGLETLLDEMRDGRRDVTEPSVELLLKSVDCLRDMLTSLRDDTDFDAERVAEMAKKIEVMLGNKSPEVESETAAESSKSEEKPTGWTIHFVPHLHMLQTGNDTIRMLRELATLGDLDIVNVDAERLPALEDLDPEESFFGWDMVLTGDVTREQIDEVFEWVDGDCDLEISARDAKNDQNAEPVVESTTAEHTQEKAEPNKGEENKAKLKVAPPPVEKRSGERRQAGSERRQSSSGEAGSIRVSIDKVDALINMVGELVITQSMLNQLGEDFDMSRVTKLRAGLAELERNTRELQENVMRIRMMPISFAFNRFPRMVHDLSQKFSKEVELKLTGEQTELDKTVMEKIGDPLVHLVRNSLDHGLETPEVREAAGKPRVGTLSLNAYHQGGNIIIEVADDGAGLNKERIVNKARERGLISEDEVLSDEKINDMIFMAGFSTADVVSDVSGRGVGMDVVRRNIKDLGGSIEVTSEEGVGSTFTIRLPLTLAILDGQLVRVGSDTFIIPLVSIVESLQIKEENYSVIAGKTEVYKLRDEYLPIVRLYDVFSLEPDTKDVHDGLLVVVEGNGSRSGILVDDLLGQQQVVIKSLETNYQKVNGVSGATILGDGTVALILDVGGVIQGLRRPARSGKKAVDEKTAA